MLKPTESRARLVLAQLDHLDDLLRPAYERAQEIFEREADGEPRPWIYRGLHVSPGEARRLVDQEPCTPMVGADFRYPASLDTFTQSPIWGEIGTEIGLSAFDQAITVLALAPELDRRYERLYAYLQDDVTRRRPSVSLALDVLCPTAENKLEWRSRLGSASPLVHHGLLELVPEPDRFSPSWLDLTLRLDQQAVAHLVGDESLSQQLVPFCEVVVPDERRPFDRQDLAALTRLLVEARQKAGPLTVCFAGPRGTHQKEVAESLAAAAEAPLLLVDVSRALKAPESFGDAIEAAFRYAWLRDAILLIDRVDMLTTDAYLAQMPTFQHTLVRHRGIAILNSTQPWVRDAGPSGILSIPFRYPDFAERRAVWRASIRGAGMPEDPGLLDAIAGRFVLTQAQIASATVEARLQIRLLEAEQPGGGPPVECYERELLAAARAQAGHDLAALARKVDPIYSWTDIVLPEEIEGQLREIAARASLRYRVLEEWGFGEKLSQARGISALFTGPSGSGKTMAAEVLANHLSIDLYKIDLSAVVSKYIGETEKNLERIFTAAERSNAILFFDEADALFGKRSEVHDAHDRYANIEISYLLQRMEQYEGIAILATNLRGNLDEAFVRRLAFTVRFSLPEEPQRQRIWEQVWPSLDLLAADVDLRSIAGAFKLSGGNIRNIALAASFFAAERNEPITQDDLLRALQRELEKVGKSTSIEGLRESITPAAAA